MSDEAIVGQSKLTEFLTCLAHENTCVLTLEPRW